MHRTLPWAVALALAVVNSARAAEPARPMAPPAGHSLHGEAFDEGPHGAAYLKPGMGEVDFAVTAAGPEARAFINQGVAQLHSFYYFEAERSFRQAAKLDPDCALAYWGMAMANVHNEKRARGFAQEARRRDAKISPREKLYLDALDALYRDGAAEKTRKRGFLLGLETIVQEHPGDLDARAWLAMAAWQNFEDGGSRQAIEALLEAVERSRPMHPGLHHYRIHLWDGARPKQAERSAALYARAAPGIAHAWHMPGHTYTALRRYADAAYQQEGSARVDHAAMARDRVLPFEIHNYAHNNQWLAATLGHLGRVRDAVAVARNLVEQPRDPQRNARDDIGSAQRSGRIRWAEALVRAELWDDLLAATDSGALDWTDAPDEVRRRAYTLGLASAAKGDRAKLAAQVAVLKALPDDSKNPVALAAAATAYITTPLGTQAALAELEGYQKLADGDVGAAFERFARATAMRPEALARAHLAAHNFGLAEAVAKAAVATHSDEVPPLAAYVEVLHAAGKDDEARTAYRTLRTLARTADPDLPVFRRLAPIVASWKEEPGPASAPTTDEATAHRIDLATLGPLTWEPWDAAPFSKPDADGRPWTLADHRGRNVVLLLYLGGKCPHCLTQLRAFGKEVDAFRSLNADVVAVGTDGPEELKALKAEAASFPMPLLADLGQDVFRAYLARDDFEDRPLHGTFLIDTQGKVRYRRIAADPFQDVPFLKAELARINRPRR